METEKLIEELAKAELPVLYNLDDFIPGRNNSLLPEIISAIVNGQLNFNPLFIYGKTSVGKTHLLSSIGKEYQKLNPAKKVTYFTDGKFCELLVETLMNDQWEPYRKKICETDFMLFETSPIMFEKERTTQELLSILEELYDKKKQIIISSIYSLNYVPGSKSAFIRFIQKGKTVKLSKADPEALKEILKRKAEKNNFPISEEVLSLIAKKFARDTRTLIGALLKVIAYSKMNNETITLNQVKKLIY